MAGVVPPVIKDALTPHSVAPIIHSATPAYSATRSSISTLLHQSSWFWGDQRVWWLVGGVAVGFYFGFRVGVVSGRARSYLASKRLMRAAALNSYEGVKVGGGAYTAFT